MVIIIIKWIPSYVKNGNTSIYLHQGQSSWQTAEQIQRLRLYVNRYISAINSLTPDDWSQHISTAMSIA